MATALSSSNMSQASASSGHSNNSSAQAPNFGDRQLALSQGSANTERQLAAAAAAASFTAMQPSSSSRWIFSSERLLKTPSIREGMSPEEELEKRRSAAHTIHKMADRLNQESRVRISQLCICAAMMHMHRFFVFHSFYQFDPRDVAAACLFLAGKSEECPRKLEHVVRVWWAVKFANLPSLDSTRYHDASHLLVTLENLILQTIAFDLSVDIPHPYVLTHMQHFARGNRKLSEIAYWFASDMLHMTDWGVRYPAKSLACVCIQMACLWAAFEACFYEQRKYEIHTANNSVIFATIPPQSNCLPWFAAVDPTMKINKLFQLTEEFSRIYKTHGEYLNIKKYAIRSSSRDTESTSSTSLPPPPTAPLLTNPNIPGKTETKMEPARRIDINDYKQRANASQLNNPQNSAPQTQRRNFMRPDSIYPSGSGKSLDLPLPPAIANEKQQSTSKQSVGTSKIADSQKSMQTVKYLDPKSKKPIKIGTDSVSDHELRLKRRQDDFEKDAKHRRNEKPLLEGKSIPSFPPLMSVNIAPLAKHRDERHDRSSLPKLRDEHINNRSREDIIAQKRPKLMPTLNPASGSSIPSSMLPMKNAPHPSAQLKSTIGDTMSAHRGPPNWSGTGEYHGVQNQMRGSQQPPHRYGPSTAPSSSRSRSRENPSVINGTEFMSNNLHYKQRSRNSRPQSPTSFSTPSNCRSQRPNSPSSRLVSSSNHHSRRYRSSTNDAHHLPNKPHRHRNGIRSNRHHRHHQRRRSLNFSQPINSSDRPQRASSGSRMLSTLPPPPLPPASDELEDGEVL